MPLGRGVRYRWKTYPSGKKVRLAFKGNKVIEVKPEGGEAKIITTSNSKIRRKVRGRNKRRR